MRPIDDAQRRRLLGWSALFCAIPLCLAPLAGRSSFELAREQAAFDDRFSAPELQSVWSDEPVHVARDPFIPETAQRGEQSGSQSSVVGMTVTQGQNTGFALPVTRTAGLPNVTAIVTGPSPRALIDDGLHVRVVAVGDTLAGSRVASIDGFGVRLQNGRVLAIAEDGF